MAKWTVRMNYGQDKFIVDAANEEEAKVRAIELSMMEPVRGEVYDVRPFEASLHPAVREIYRDQMERMKQGEDHAT